MAKRINRKGFTLIELLAVIVILSIIAFIAILVVTNRVEESKKASAEVSALNYISAFHKDMILSELKDGVLGDLESNKKYYLIEESIYIEDEGEVNEIYLNNLVSMQGEKPVDGYIILDNNKEVETAYFIINGYEVECLYDTCSVKRKYDATVKPNDSLLGHVASLTSEVESITVQDEVYNTHVYIYDGDQTWTSNMTFGDESDVGASGTYAKNMVIVKVNGNLTINSGVKVTTTSTSYGGPKGFVLYVTGTLTNNGEITGTAKGAYAEGQNVYLWQNKDETYEYVPAIGATGGTARTGKGLVGYKGNDGTNRQTGGGGSGSTGNGSTSISGTTFVSGAGGTGTSYSGGSGGAAFVTVSSNKGTLKSGSGSSVGGSGGAAYNIATNGHSAGGGAGNPGGYGYRKTSGVSPVTDKTNSKGKDGTGGLIIIYADNLINNGSVTSYGSAGGSYAAINTSQGYKDYGGGSSGGGSINLFYRKSLVKGTVEATGGGLAGVTIKGGSGGAGSVTIGSIATGTFVKDE